MNLNETVIEQAKNYAKNNSVRLSKLIESYLASLTTSEKKLKPIVSPLVESLTGVIPEKIAVIIKVAIAIIYLKNISDG